MHSTHIDLTHGNIWKKLFLFFLPIMAGSLFQQLYTTVDAVIIGHYAGKSGLAAIDSVCSLLRLPVNFLTGLSAGAAVIISQYFGAKKQQKLSEAVNTAISAAIAGGVKPSARINFKAKIRDLEQLRSKERSTAVHHQQDGTKTLKCCKRNV